MSALSSLGAARVGADLSTRWLSFRVRKVDAAKLKAKLAEPPDTTPTNPAAVSAALTAVDVAPDFMLDPALGLALRKAVARAAEYGVDLEWRTSPSPPEPGPARTDAGIWAARAALLGAATWGLWRAGRWALT